jgi:hypothetical protein
MFLVNHSLPLLEALLANQCLRFVTSHRVTYYITQYVTKHSGEDAASVNSVLAAFARYNARQYAQSHDGQSITTVHSDKELESKAFDVGVGTVLSMLRAYTSNAAVSSQQAAWLVLGNSTFGFSHNRFALPLKACVEYLEGRPYQQRLSESYVSSSPITYACRDDKLNEVCMYEFGDQYKVIPGVGSAEDALRLLPHHPKAHSHSIVRRSATDYVMPMLSGQRPADLSTLHQTDTQLATLSDERRAKVHADREYYASMALVLFVPWRTLTDLKLPDENWWAAYIRHRDQLAKQPHAQVVLSNFQRYHEEPVLFDMDDAELPAEANQPPLQYEPDSDVEQEMADIKQAQVHATASLQLHDLLLTCDVLDCC